VSRVCVGWICVVSVVCGFVLCVWERYSSQSVSVTRVRGGSVVAVTPLDRRSVGLVHRLVCGLEYRLSLSGNTTLLEVSKWRCCLQPGWRTVRGWCGDVFSRYAWSWLCIFSKFFSAACSLGLWGGGLFHLAQLSCICQRGSGGGEM